MPKCPTWVRLAAIFTNRMNEATIEARKVKLQEYLNLLASHLVTRSTPYFEQVFGLTPKAIIYWVKDYEGFDGVRRIRNK